MSLSVTIEGSSRYKQRPTPDDGVMCCLLIPNKVLSYWHSKKCNGKRMLIHQPTITAEYIAMRIMRGLSDSLENNSRKRVEQLNGLTSSNARNHQVKILHNV